MDGPAGVSNAETVVVGTLPAWFVAGCQAAGWDLSPRADSLLGRYLGLLLEHNARFNLTGLKTAEGISSELLLDSVALAAWLRERGLDGPTVDVGSGAGIPGLVMAILRPEPPVTLVEATAKKARFLELVRDELGLANVTVEGGRSEDLAHRPELRGAFSVATARGLAAMPALLELTLPFLRAGGSLVAVKGPGVEGEVEAASRALEKLGGQVLEVAEPAGRPGTRLVRVRLEREAPAVYPRRAGVPVKRPL